MQDNLSVFIMPRFMLFSYVNFWTIRNMHEHVLMFDFIIARMTVFTQSLYIIILINIMTLGYREYLESER